MTGWDIQMKNISLKVSIIKGKMEKLKQVGSLR